MPKPRVPQEEQAGRRKQWRADNAEKRREYIKAWREKNKDHVAAYAKAHEPSEESREVKRAYDKRYYEEVFKNDPKQVALSKERGKKWVAENPDKANARLQKYRETHREVLNARNKAYYYSKSEDERKADRAARAEYSKQWREANREKLIEDSRARYAENKEDYHEYYKKHYPENRHDNIARAEDRQRNLRQRGTYTKADVEALYDAQRGKCAGCGIKMVRTRERAVKSHYEVDHVMPVALGGNNTADNLQLLCGPCNNRKRALHPDEWAARIGKLFV